MTPAIVCGSAHSALGEQIASVLGVAPCDRSIERFPDGEMRIVLREPVRGRDVYVVQPTSAPVGENLLELAMLGDAAVRAGAETVIAVVPYFGYARADRRQGEGEPLAGRLAADLIGAAGFARMVVVDLHAPAIEGFFRMPVEHLDPRPAVIAALRPLVPKDAVVVSPDLGGAKRADAIGRMLGLPVAIVHKQRTSGSAVAALRITGDVEGLAPVIVDDMISTGGTIAAAIGALTEHGARDDVTVVATHGLFAAGALSRLGASVKRFVVTDTVPQPSAPSVIVAGLAPLLADAIRRLHDRESLRGLLRES
jgi:ribose-phosphate pyrophosphokinase